MVNVFVGGIKVKNLILMEYVLIVLLMGVLHVLLVNIMSAINVLMKQQRSRMANAYVLKAYS